MGASIRAARAWALRCALWMAFSACLAQEHGIAPASPELADSLKPESSPPMVSIYPKWKIDESTRIGRRSRPMAMSQNAWPACFAAAASQALDMSQCSDDHFKGAASCSKLSDANRVSSLWLSKVGPEVSGAGPNKLIMPSEGGSAFGALRYALGMGSAPSAKACPWPKGDPKGEQVERQRQQESWLSQARQAKRKQRELEASGADPHSYISQYWRAQWAKAMAKGYPDLGAKALGAMDIPDAEQAMGAALWSPGCDEPTMALAKASVASMPSQPTWQANLEKLQALLESGREPIVSVCLDLPVSKTWSQCKLRHAFVVIGLAKFKGEGGPMDGGWGLWALNSWGERWQEASQDGWVRAEPLMARMQGDFEWVELDGRKALDGSKVWPTYAKEHAMAHWRAKQAASLVEPATSDPRQ